MMYIRIDTGNTPYITKVMMAPRTLPVVLVASAALIMKAT